MRLVSCTALAVLVLQAVPAPLEAHHTGDELSTPSTRCGWLAAADMHDRSNLSDFCGAWIPAELRVRSVMARHERLWIELPPDTAAALGANDRSVAALLHDWLARWRTVTGYRTASVVLLRGHVEFARVWTTMTGDVVALR